MLVICPIFDRCDLLPFYLQYYGSLGATEFVIALWNGERNPVYEVVKSYTAWPITIRTSIECLVKDYNGPDESVGLNRIVNEFRQKHAWYCLADLDEFCWFQGRTMPEAAAEAEASGYSAIHGVFHDRFAHNGRYPTIRQLHTLDATFPMVADVTRCLGANHNKIPMAKSDLPVESGHHMTKGRAWWNGCEVHHFKWTDGLIGRLRERDMYFTAQALPWSGESRRFLDCIEDDNYREDPNYRWREARKLGI